MKKSTHTSRRSTVKISAQVQQYLLASLSDNTRLAYGNDIEHFLKWGGRIPSSPEHVASYLAEHANKLTYATLSRRVIAIGRAHTAKGIQSPAHSEIVRATLHGIRRTYGSAQRRVSPALLQDVRKMVSGLEGIKGVRDKALLLIGFAGAFRRSELVGLQVEDIQFVKKGMIIRIRRGKTDQVGKGRDIAIPLVYGKLSPVAAVKEWLQQSGINDGCVFRRVDRNGKVANGGLSPQSVALIVKQRAKQIGLDERQYSGHSLRAGLVTSAANSGVSSWKICQQTGHQSAAMMQRYIRGSRLFVDNPLGKIG
ncbi:MAG: site-specific integrase [Nitrosomonadales bacterium]